MKPNDRPMERWESWPLWALGLSNGLNIVLWYVLSMARVDSPELPIGILGALSAWLPLIIVAAAIAQAFSLDGALIATIAGMRHGRVGKWSYATIVGAGLFSAAISYAVHSGRIDQLPVLHVASALILILYNLHLAQPRKLLTVEPDRARSVPSRKSTVGEIEDLGHIKGFRCLCGDIFPTLSAVKVHKKNDCPQTVMITDLPAGNYDLEPVKQNGKHNV